MSISDIAGQVKTKRSTCQGRKLQPRGIPVKEGRILAEEAGTARRGDDAEGGSFGSSLGRRLVILGGEDQGRPDRIARVACGRGRVWSSRRGCVVELLRAPLRPWGRFLGPGWESGHGTVRSVPFQRTSAMMKGVLTGH